MGPPIPSLHHKLRGQARRFRSLFADAHAVQLQQLRTILKRNQGCEYGKYFRFSSITRYEEFKQRVPIVRYESLRSDIERMAAGEPLVLVSDKIVAFETTGGSSGGSKLVPHTKHSLAAFRRGLLPWLDDLYTSVPLLSSGTAYWSISPACRECRFSDGGIPIGLESDAAYFGAELAADIIASLSVPAGVGMVRDVNVWRYLSTCYLLADAQLSLISVWSPSFLLELLRYATAHTAVLTNAIAEGNFGANLPNGPCAHLSRRVADPERAQHVALALANQRFDQLWPQLRLISCWDQASSKTYAADVRRMFPGVQVQGKGLLATEGLVSIPLSGLSMPVLALESGFYEFLDENGVAHLVDDLENGADYELVITNDSGFYRYAIGDRVRVEGFAGRTPLLQFIGRCGVVSDLCGEKLSDDFVLRVLDGLGLRFAALAPQPAPARGYALLLDADEVPPGPALELAAQVDAALRQNPQYAYARVLRQLEPTYPARCMQPLQSWINTGLRRGQQLGDIKVPALYPHDDWRNCFHVCS